MQENNISLKIISDHIRSSIFLLSESITPSNEGRGYILRRIIRRMLIHIRKLNKRKYILTEIAKLYIDKYSSIYKNDLTQVKDFIIYNLKNEEDKFTKNIDNIIDLLYGEISKIKSNNKVTNKPLLSGKFIYKLYDTYGLPIDIAIDIAKEHNLDIDLDQFNIELNKQKLRSKKANNMHNNYDYDFENYLKLLFNKYNSTIFLGYDNNHTYGKIIAILKNKKEISYLDNNSFNDEDIFEIIIDKTVFYANSGGQEGDDGNIILQSDYNEDKLKQEYNNIINISSCNKYKYDIYSHRVENIAGLFKVGDNIISYINKINRELKSQNHSATHLLHKILKEYLGNIIMQKGSYINHDYFTFDFNFDRGLTREEIYEIEDRINFHIRENNKLSSKIMDIDDAKNSGALALFGEKYDQKVRVVAIDNISKELCGGTHIGETANIGLFKIISEKSIGSGIRRITAKTGYNAILHNRLIQESIDKILSKLKINHKIEYKFNNNINANSKIGFNKKDSFNNMDNYSNIMHNDVKISMADNLEQLLLLIDNKNNHIKKIEQENKLLHKNLLLNNIKNNIKITKIQNISYGIIDIDKYKENDILPHIKDISNLLSLDIISIIIDNKSSSNVILLMDKVAIQNKINIDNFISLINKEFDRNSKYNKKFIRLNNILIDKLFYNKLSEIIALNII